MIAIGVGANSLAERGEFVMAIANLAHKVGAADVVATLGQAKFAEFVKDAATSQAIAYVGLSLEDMQQRSDECVTRSERALELFGVASIAEAAALVAAGEKSKLIAPREVFGSVTVAAAKSADHP